MEDLSEGDRAFDLVIVAVCAIKDLVSVAVCVIKDAVEALAVDLAVIVTGVTAPLGSKAAVAIML